MSTDNRGFADTSRPVCPKCHQPLDDGDEVYICCADASLEWRCQDCGKVSDGFAFPYGMCPVCGGVLQTLGSRRIRDDAALEAIRDAFEIELGGMAFYRRAAEEAQEPELRELFQRLSEMETEHMQTLARRYHVTMPDIPRDFRVGQAAIYAGVDNHPEDPVNLFRIAIGFEERAAAFFTAQCERAPSGSMEAELYRELAAEEHEHATLLRTELQRHRQGKPGLL